MGGLAPDPWFDGGYWRDPRCDFSLSADMAQPPHLPSDLFDCRGSDADCDNHRVATQNKSRMALASVTIANTVTIGGTCAGKGAKGGNNG